MACGSPKPFSLFLRTPPRTDSLVSSSMSWAPDLPFDTLVPHTDPDLKFSPFIDFSSTSHPHLQLTWNMHGFTEWVSLWHPPHRANKVDDFSSPKNFLATSLLRTQPQIHFLLWFLLLFILFLPVSTQRHTGLFFEILDAIWFPGPWVPLGTKHLIFPCMSFPP